LFSFVAYFKKRHEFKRQTTCSKNLLVVSGLVHHIAGGFKLNFSEVFLLASI
jgi:hypothetical protein